MDPQEWLAGYDRQLTETARTTQAAGDELRQVSGHAVAPRGEAEVTVSAAGALERLTLTPAARTLEVDQLAELIVATARRAQADAAAQVADVLTEHYGDGPALRLVTGEAEPSGEPADDDYFANPPEVHL